MTEPYLEHYGIPGMKWGVRKARKSSSKGKNRRPSRQERKANKLFEKQKERDFYEKRVSDTINKALADPKVLVRINTPGSKIPTIATGTEFIDYLSRGGVFDIKTTDIYATFNAQENRYEIDRNSGSRYKKE